MSAEETLMSKCSVMRLGFQPDCPPADEWCYLLLCETHDTTSFRIKGSCCQ